MKKRYGLKSVLLKALFLFAICTLWVFNGNRTVVEAYNNTIILEDSENVQASQQRGVAVLTGDRIELRFNIDPLYRINEYVWYKNGSQINIAGNNNCQQTDNSLIINYSESSDNGTYYVKAFDLNGNCFISEKVVVKVTDSIFSGEVSIVDEKNVYWAGESYGFKIEINSWGGSGIYECQIEMRDAATGNVEYRGGFSYNEYNKPAAYISGKSKGLKKIYITMKDSFGSTINITKDVSFVEPISVELYIDGKNDEVVTKWGRDCPVSAVITGGTGDYTARVHVYDTEDEDSYEFNYNFSDDFTMCASVPHVCIVYMMVSDSTNNVAYSQKIKMDILDFGISITNYEEIPKEIVLGDSIEIGYKIFDGKGPYSYFVKFLNQEVENVEWIEIYDDIGVITWTPDIATDDNVMIGIYDETTDLANLLFLRLCVTKEGIYQESDGSWRYYTKNKFNSAFTGMAQKGNEIWYIKNGVFVDTYTGMYLYNGKWIYVKNGKYDATYTGMAKNSAGVWYMKNGVLDRTYTGMYIYDGSWIYVNKGKYDTTYTGLATNSYGTWYMQNGKLDRTFSGKVTINGKTYTIKNGKML